MRQAVIPESTKISVIIPTFNGADTLRELLAALSIQTVKPDEVLVIDSSSTDNTVEIAQFYGAQTQIIPPGSFDHGGTRTKAAKMAQGDILVYFTQDALPAHRQVLEALTQPFTRSPEIAVTYGRQKPSFRANDIAGHLRLFNYPEESVTRGFADRENYGFQTIFASNSCSAYRREQLADVGFFKQGLIFGEDTCAVGKLLQNGCKIAYVAEAAIYHSHNYEWSEEFRRYFDIGVLHTTEQWLLDVYGGTGSRGSSYVRSGLHYLWKRRNYSAIGDFMVRVALKFFGYQLGRRYHLFPGKIVPAMSLHSNWWIKQKAD